MRAPFSKCATLLRCLHSSSFRLKANSEMWSFGEEEVLIGAVDQGTSSSRFLLFSSRTRNVVSCRQIEVGQTYPNDGWVEMDPCEMLAATNSCIQQSCAHLEDSMGISVERIKAVGVTNQRETTIIWDKNTGEPLYNAIVWLDARTANLAEKMTNLTKSKEKDALKSVCGLPIHPYFSALKIKWLIENVPRVAEAVDRGDALFGTVDTWLIWKLTNGRSHVTDVTNASRTMLMNLETRNWDENLLNFFQIPKHILPQIRSSAEEYGRIESGCLKNVPIAGCLGDQQAAMVGHLCLEEGAAKNTYGTGTFLLCNTGTKAVQSKHGLLTTVAFQLGPQMDVYYALEGAGSIGGTAVRWLRDKLNLIQNSTEVESLAKSVPNSGGVVFVPAFSGLFCPQWDPSARGTLLGLSQQSGAGQLARATLEAVACQTADMADVIKQDCPSLMLTSLTVDGGMTANRLLMEIQADLLGISVLRPDFAESTAFGAAVAAGITMGVWRVEDLLRERDSFRKYDEFLPNMSENERNKKMEKWREALRRAQHWAV